MTSFSSSCAPLGSPPLPATSSRLRILAPLTVWGISPVDLVRVAASSGYDAVGIKIYSAMQAAMPFPLTPGSALMRELQAALADTGLTVWDVETFLLEPQRPVRELQPLLDIAAHLSARHLLCGSMITDPQQGAEHFAELCDLAAPLELSANLEFFVSWPGASDLPGALATVVAADRPNGKLLIDTLHAWRSHVSPQMLQALPAERLGYVQICDAASTPPPDLAARVREAMEQRLLPGTGSIPLVAMLQALPRHLPVSVEVPCQPHMTLAQAHAHASAALQATDRVLQLADTAPSEQAQL